MPKIKKVEAIPFSIPLRHVVQWGAAGKMSASDHVLVRITTDDGIVGIGEVTPRPTIYGETQASATHIVEAHFGPALIGKDLHNREALWLAMEPIRGNPTARGAVDLALADAAAQAAGLPLAAFLGGAVQPVPTSYMAGLGSTAQVVAEVMEIHEKTGIMSFKIKAGKDPAVDLENIRQLNAALDGTAFLYIDANQLYTPDVAIRTINQMAEHGLGMVEEPVRIEFDQQRLHVARSIPVPILADDSVTTVWDARREAQAGAIGVMGIKLARTGLHDSLRILHVAEAFGLPLWVGSQGVSGIGTLASAHFAAAFPSIKYPADLGNVLKMDDDLLDTPITFRDGKLILPDGPGIGGRVDEKKLARYRCQ